MVTKRLIVHAICIFASLTSIATIGQSDDSKPVTSSSATSNKVKNVKLAAPPAKLASELLRLHNLIRAKNKKPGFRLDATLSSTAQKYAHFMAKNKKYGHSVDGRTPDKRIDAEGYNWGNYGENIAWGMESPSKAVEIWMNSPSHRENILADKTEVGFGVVEDVWVAVFATPLDEYIEKKKKERKAAASRAASSSR